MQGRGMAELIEMLKSQGDERSSKAANGCFVVVVFHFYYLYPRSFQK